MSLSAAAATLVGCSEKKAAVAGLKDPVQKARAHTLAMFLLALHKNYLTEILQGKVQPTTPPQNLLTKVDATVFKNMQAFFIAEKNSIGEQPLRKQLMDMQALMVRASNYPKAAADSDVPYPTPEDCPCEYIKGCAPVESLLAFT